jgi:hypothetical protein
VSKITDEQKAEFRAVQAEVLAAVERLNVILVETRRDYRAHLKFERMSSIWDDVEDDGDDALALDRPSQRIGGERGEREEEAEPLPADDGDDA